MAKSTKLMHMAVADIHWFTARNVGRHNSNNANDVAKKTLAVSLAGGWMIGSPLEASPATEMDIEAAIKEREMLWASLKAQQDDVVINIDQRKIALTPADVLVAWEREYVSKGKVRKPSQIGTYAYQRASVIPMALALREKIAKGSGLPLPEGYTIPTIVETYDDDLERILACVRENTSKSLGATNVMLDWPSLFVACRAIHNAMVAKGETFTESRLRQRLGWPDTLRGRSQRLYFLIQLNQHVEKYKIENPNNGCDLDIEAEIVLNAKNVGAWRFEKDSPVSMLKPQLDAGTATIEDIKALFYLDVVTGPKLPTRTDLLERRKNSTNKMEQLILTAVIENKLGVLSTLPNEYNKLVNQLFNENCPLNTDLTIKKSNA